MPRIRHETATADDLAEALSDAIDDIIAWKSFSIEGATVQEQRDLARYQRTLAAFERARDSANGEAN